MACRGKHALYHEPGNFYQNLTEFPGALFDGNGYVVFPTESEYLRAAGLKHGVKLNVPGGNRRLRDTSRCDEPATFRKRVTADPSATGRSDLGPPP